MALLNLSSSGIKYLGDNSSHTDLILHLKDGSVRAHRSILSATCKTVKRCLNSSTSSRVSDDCSSMIILPDFKVSEAKAFLDVLYGRIREASGEGVEDFARTLKFKWLEGEEDEIECKPCYVRLKRSKELERLVLGREAKRKSPRKRKIGCVIKEEESEDVKVAVEPIVIPLSLNEHINTGKSDNKVKENDAWSTNGWEEPIPDGDNHCDDNGYFDMDNDNYGGSDGGQNNGDTIAEGDHNYSDFIGHDNVVDDQSKDEDFIGHDNVVDGQSEDDDFISHDDVLPKPKKRKKSSIAKKRVRSQVSKIKFCPVCQANLRFMKEDEVLKHLSDHNRPNFKRAGSNQNWFSCPGTGDTDCKYSHPDADAVQAHVRLTHQKRYCLYCDSFVDGEDLHKHKIDKHPGFPSSTCPYFQCSKVFAPMSKIPVMKHMIKEHKGEYVRLEEDPERPGSIICSKKDCKYTTMDRFDLISHLMAKHNIYMCPFCLKLFKDRGSWLIHPRLYHKTHIFTCKREMVFATKEAMQEHMLSSEHAKICLKTKPVTSDPKNFLMCPTCGRLTKGKHNCAATRYYKMERKVDLPRHPKLMIDNRDENGKWPCPDEGCNYGPFKNAAKRDAHFNHVHYKIPCNYCNKVVSYMYMEKHVAFMHTGDTKRIPCPMCPEMFFNGTLLIEHKEKMHSNKTFMCTICGDVFPNKRMEQIHRHEKHTRKRKFPCPVCGHIFRSRTLVKAHARQSHGLDIDIKKIVSL